MTSSLSWKRSYQLSYAPRPDDGIISSPLMALYRQAGTRLRRLARYTLVHRQPLPTRVRRWLAHLLDAILLRGFLP